MFYKHKIGDAATGRGECVFSLVWIRWKLLKLTLLQEIVCTQTKWGSGEGILQAQAGYSEFTKGKFPERSIVTHTQPTIHTQTDTHTHPPTHLWFPGLLSISKPPSSWILHRIQWLAPPDLETHACACAHKYSHTHTESSSCFPSPPCTNTCITIFVNSAAPTPSLAMARLQLLL